MDEISRLKKQVEDLSFRVTMLERRLNVPPSIPVKEATPAPSVVAPSQSIPEPHRETLEQKVGGTWLNRLGVIALVMGLAFFLKYAFDNNWIGVLGRLAIGFGAGVVCLLAGHYYQHRGGLPRFGVGLSAAGVGAWYVTSYAAYGYYALLSHALAFMCFLAITLVAVVLACTYRNKALLGLASLLGFITPLIIGGAIGYEPKVLYLLVLNIGLLGVVIQKRWSRIAYINLIGTYVVFVYTLERHLTKDLWPRFLVLLSLLHIVFVAYSIWCNWRRSSAEEPQTRFVWVSSIIYVFMACAIFDMK